jgi:ABC-2 type transport system permease protein
VKGTQEIRGSMIQTLIWKDWTFQRVPIAICLAAGLIALYLIGSGGKGSFYLGSTLLISVVIGLGIQLAMATVVEERTQGTLPFLLSLPVSPRDYTVAKLIANMVIFIAPWTLLLLATLGVIASNASLPDGLIPYAVLLMGEMFVGYVIVLAVAIVSESQAWAIGAIVATNLLFQGCLYGFSNLPGLAGTLERDAIHWSPLVFAILGGELVVVVGLLALTLFLQGRKTHFL